jgi:hypothetical protein
MQGSILHKDFLAPHAQQQHVSQQYYSSTEGSIGSILWMLPMKWIGFRALELLGLRFRV